MKQTNKYTFLFREKNLEAVIDLLSENVDGSLQNSKAVLLVGASAEELVSIWVYAQRKGLYNYQFVGINNSVSEINRVQRFLSNFCIENYHAHWEKSGVSVLEDVEKGILVEDDVFEGIVYSYKLNPRISNQISILELDALTELDSPSILFDAVICNNMLVHFDSEERRSLISNMIKHLKPGGIYTRDNCDQRYSEELSGEKANEEIELMINSAHLNELKRLDVEEGLNVYKHINT